ncbi:hypothetical protein O7606_12430 [Micromonospora sp. WMMD882]|uniref:hypothetical protein n=1 Tax=Micromonospora sp. WMMD882 TaxID=3015151 RepID=UPI00248C3375|nr:hypothetical protein [Micromonospora sp. WMMD882]WBB82096.1 hypothetical protein O7606_12430 [Micromonospora sp. WMMD882]
MITLLEAGSLYLTGLTLAGILSMAFLPSVTSVPIVGQRVVAGDLKLSAPQVLLTLLGLLVVAFVVVVATDLLRRSPESTPRPSLSSAVPSRVRYLPLGVSAAMLSVALLLPGKTGGAIALASVVAFLLGVPLIASTVLVELGRSLQKLPYPATLLAGRRMERRPVTVARPLLGISVLTLLLTSGAGFLAVMGTGDPSPVRDPSTVSYRVDALDLRDLDIRRMQDALPAAAVLPYAFAPESGRLLLGARCADVRKVVRTACDPSRPFVLDEAATDRVQRIIGGVPGSGGFQLTEPGTVAARGTFVLVPRQTVSDGAVRRAVSRSFVAPIAVTPEDLGTQRESPLVPWLYAGLTAAALCIGVAALVMATDGFLRARRENEVLRALGLTATQVTKFEASQFGFAYGATVGTSFLVGCALCVLLTIIGDAEAVPWIALGTILVGLVGGAVAAVTSLIAFGRLQHR